MTFSEYQTLARRTQNQSLDVYEKQRHALYGLAAECGEVLGKFQKALQGHYLIIEDVSKEIGDVLWMIAELADTLTLNLDEVAQQNIDKLRKRYPDGFSVDRSRNREV